MQGPQTHDQFWVGSQPYVILRITSKFDLKN
jgi:hypothetical protein